MVMSLGTSVFADITTGTDSEGNTIYYEETTGSNDEKIVTYYTNDSGSTKTKVVTTSSDGSTVTTEEYDSEGTTVEKTTVVYTDSKGNVTTTVTDSSGTTTTYTITIDNSTENYTYVAYQIFDGDLSDDGTTLSNITFGTALSATDRTDLISYYSGSDGGSVLDGTDYTQDAAGLAAALADKKIDAAAFAAKVASYTLTEAGTSSYSSTNSNYTISVTDAGYYLVKNTEVPSGNYAYSSYILEVVESVTVSPKNTTVPTPGKTVTETNDSSSDSSTTGNVADYDVGDNVPFTLTAIMSEDYDDYTVYKLTFHDTLSTGLTFNYDVKVYVDETEVLETGKNGTEDVTNYTVNYTSGEAQTDGCTFEVVFTNTNSLYNASGDKITVAANSVIKVTYTAKLTSEAVYGETTNKVKLTYSNNPNETDGSTTGTSEEPVVYVYDFTLTVSKVDDSNNALTGAGFTLYKLDATSGEYKEYNNTYASASTGSSFTFSGLDAGTYKLVETTTPDGYNTAGDIVFVVKAEYGTDGKITGLKVYDSDGTTELTTFTATYSTGVIETTVENNKGSNIPSTGGIGTTIFYVVGAILVLGAGVVLITRKRMGNRA